MYLSEDDVASGVASKSIVVITGAVPGELYLLGSIESMVDESEISSKLWRVWSSRDILDLTVQVDKTGGNVAISDYRRT